MKKNTRLIACNITANIGIFAPNSSTFAPNSSTFAQNNGIFK